MLEGVVHGLLLVLHWPAFGYLLLGVFMGLWLGAVPGLGGITGMVIVLPFIYGMDPVSAFAVLIAIHAVVSTGDTIPAIMLGVPGTASAQATVLDGYPLAKQGQAARAFGAAFTCSALGGVLGALAMAVSLPIALPLILSFGSPEFFLLGLLGLTMVGTVSGNALTKGLGAALIGLLISQVGYPPASDTPRYWFNIQYLANGVPLVPLVLGVFAFPELLDLAVRDASIADVPREQSVGLMEGVKDVFRHWALALRCSAIGVYIGMLPGLGAAIVDWVAYGHAVQSTKAKDNPRFGDGDIRGVIAPEAATHSIRGGDLIPTVAIGIPGSASMAILLGAMLILGLQPGRDMLTTKLDITYSMVWTLVIANLIGAAVLMQWSRQVAKAAFINGHLIVPGVMLLMFMGAWLQTPELASWVTFLGFGALGVVMRRAGWPRPALVLGFVLGPIMEKALVITTEAFTFTQILHRRLFVILAAVVLLALYHAVRTARHAHRASSRSQAPREPTDNTALSWLLALVVLVVFAAAIPPAFHWPHSAKLFPLAISTTGLVILGATLWRDSARLCVAIRTEGTLGAVLRKEFASPEYIRTGKLLAWTAAVVLLTPLIGQQAALVTFVGLYLLRWGRFRWYWCAIYALISWGVLFGLYDHILHVPWVPPLHWR